MIALWHWFVQEDRAIYGAAYSLRYPLLLLGGLYLQMLGTRMHQKNRGDR